MLAVATDRAGGKAEERFIGYNAGAFDGRFFYCAPWRSGPHGGLTAGVHGNVLRYDTLDPASVFALRASDFGHNGGLCAAPSGPTFLVNTDRGATRAAAHRPLPPGIRQLLGVYDGRSARLYIDGALAAEQPAAGAVRWGDVPLTVGCSHRANDRLRGRVIRHHVERRAWSDEEIRANYRRGANG